MKGIAPVIFPVIFCESRSRRSLREVLNEQLVSTVVTTQFLPAMRFPIYIGCGFFGLSFRRFAISVMCASVVWSPLVFTCAYFYGVYTLNWFGLLRWPIALALVFITGVAARTYWKNLTKGYDSTPLG